MKIVPIVFCFLFSCSAMADSKSDILDFGSTLLQERYTLFADKMNKCDELGNNTILSESAITKLKEIPQEAAIALAVISHKALQKCALYEYSEVLRTLVSIETHIELSNDTQLLKEINRVRPLLVADMSLYIEKEYDALPIKVKSKLQVIDELQAPFNLMNAVERTWSLDP
jgi:hypothetical protein